MLTRRTFLGSCAATCALLGGPQYSRADGQTAGKRFLFLNAQGGWDPLCVFAPLFGHQTIDMEAEAVPWTIGNLNLVDHPARPNTRAFFENHHGEVAILNGVSTRSVNHETCQVVALTGSTSPDRPDWATIMAYDERDLVSLPHLVMSGPSFTGPLSVYVSHAQGRLQQTIDRSIFEENDAPLVPPSRVATPMVDTFLEWRGQVLQSNLPQEQRVLDYGEALRRAKLLSDGGDTLQLTSSEDFVGQAQTAIAALAAGVSRCATVGSGYEWDTHGDNALQTGSYENFFGGLEQILTLLANTNGPEGTPLRDDTIVVVTSEMGRTPKYNITGGRDHWPYTSMFMMGPGIQGGRELGGFSPLYSGIGVDPGGGLDTSQPGISTQDLGATLLTLGDVDPAEHIRGGKPIPGVIA